MTALRMRARDLMTDQELLKMCARYTWKSIALIVACMDPDPRFHRNGGGMAQPFTFMLAVAISARASSDFRS